MPPTSVRISPALMRRRRSANAETAAVEARACELGPPAFRGAQEPCPSLDRRRLCAYDLSTRGPWRPTSYHAGSLRPLRRVDLPTPRRSIPELGGPNMSDRLLTTREVGRAGRCARRRLSEKRLVFFRHAVQLGVQERAHAHDLGVTVVLPLALLLTDLGDYRDGRAGDHQDRSAASPVRHPRARANRGGCVVTDRLLDGTERKREALRLPNSRPSHLTIARSARGSSCSAYQTVRSDRSGSSWAAAINCRSSRTSSRTKAAI